MSPDSNSDRMALATHSQQDLTGLFRLAGEIGREPDLNGLLLKILERSRDWMKAEACSIFLPDPLTNELVIHSAHGSSAPELGEVRVPAGKGICGSAMREKRIIKVDDVSQDPRFFGVADKKTGFLTRALIAAPLLDGDESIGVIEFLNPVDKINFDEVDIQMVEYFSWLVSASLVRIHSHEAQLQHALVQRDLDLARDMQSGLLPKNFPEPSRYPNLDLFAVLDPAYEVSGDLYDFFDVGDDRLCFLVGDVAGKGVAAGLFMAVTRTLIRAIARAQEHDPVKILESVNNYLVPENSALLFVTIILGVLNAKTGEIVYAQGGHNPPLLLQKGEPARYEPPGGQPLGVFSEANFGRRELALRPGDALIVYTDGVTEAMNTAHEQFGDMRLQKLFDVGHNEPAAKLADRVTTAVHDFVGSAEQSDDITLMVIRWVA